MFTRFPKLLMGLEILFYYDINFGKYSYLAFYPQVQARFTNEVKIDIGPGFVFTLNKLIPKFVMRVLIENFPGVEEEGDKEKENRPNKFAFVESFAIVNFSIWFAQGRVFNHYADSPLLFTPAKRFHK